MKTNSSAAIISIVLKLFRFFCQKRHNNIIVLDQIGCCLYLELSPYFFAANVVLFGLLYIKVRYSKMMSAKNQIF